MLIQLVADVALANFSLQPLLVCSVPLYESYDDAAAGCIIIALIINTHDAPQAPRIPPAKRKSE
jgi:hypothetical protein